MFWLLTRFVYKNAETPGRLNGTNEMKSRNLDGANWPDFFSEVAVQSWMTSIRLELPFVKLNSFIF